MFRSSCRVNLSCCSKSSALRHTKLMLQQISYNRAFSRSICTCEHSNAWCQQHLSHNGRFACTLQYFICSSLAYSCVLSNPTATFEIDAYKKATLENGFLDVEHSRIRTNSLMRHLSPHRWHGDYNQSDFHHSRQTVGNAHAIYH